MRKDERQVAITFKSYLVRLSELERAKPKSERKKVPTITRIAELAGISRVTGSRIMHGHVKSLSLRKLCAILDVMNSLGFETKLTDVLSYSYDSNHQNQD